MAVAGGCAGVENHLGGGFGQGVEAADDRAFGVAAGIALGGHDDGEGVIVGPVHASFGQPPFGAGEKEVERLCAQPHHQHLTFRVAEAGVVFNQPGAALFDHQACVKHALIGCAAPGHFADGGEDDFLHRLLGDRIGQDGGGAVGPHPAGVGAGVAVAHPLVILRGADGEGVFAVGQDEERGLLARHEFLDHHFGPGRTEFAAEHVVDGGNCFIHGHGDDNALAGGETIGLNDDGRTLGGDIGPGGGGFGEAGIGGRRGGAGVADFLGEGFGGFEFGRCRRGPEGEQACGPGGIRHARGKGGLWPDDDEVDGVFFAEGDDGGAGQDVDVGTFGKLRDACIAGGDDEAVCLGVLLDGPGEGMFAAPGAEDEDVHVLRPLLMAGL